MPDAHVPISPVYMISRKNRALLDAYLSQAHMGKEKKGVSIDFDVSDWKCFDGHDQNFIMSERKFDEMVLKGSVHPALLVGMDMWFRTAALHACDMWDYRTIAVGWMLLLYSICGYEGIRALSTAYHDLIGYNEFEGCNSGLDVFRANAVGLRSEAEMLRRWADFVLVIQAYLDGYYGSGPSAPVMCSVHLDCAECRPMPAGKVGDSMKTMVEIANEYDGWDDDVGSLNGADDDLEIVDPATFKVVNT